MTALTTGLSVQTRLQDKVAVVTGGARGQGASHVERLAREGACVVAADVLDDEGRAHVARLVDIGLRVDYRHVDVSDPDAWQRLVDKVVIQHRRLDVLVNNAGIIHVNPLETEDLADWQRLIDVNLTGAFLGMRAATPVMRAGGGGSIINVASIFGPVGAVGYAAYTASKAGLIGLTRTAALELAGDGIRVNAISPGGVSTPMNESEKDGGVIPETPLRRRADVAEISAAVAFLASADASFVTGTNLVVDGGFLAH